MRGAEGGNEADGPCSAAAAAREALALGGSPGDRPVLRGARAPVAVEIAGAEEERSGAVVASGARRDGADGVHVDRARRRLDAATVVGVEHRDGALLPRGRWPGRYVLGRLGAAVAAWPQSLVVAAEP